MDLFQDRMFHEEELMLCCCPRNIFLLVRDQRGVVNNRLRRLALGSPINRSLKVSYSTRLRGIKVELHLVQVHLLLFTP